MKITRQHDLLEDYQQFFEWFIGRFDAEEYHYQYQQTNETRLNLFPYWIKNSRFGILPNHTGSVSLIAARSSAHPATRTSWWKAEAFIPNFADHHPMSLDHRLQLYDIHKELIYRHSGTEGDLRHIAIFTVIVTYNSAP